MPDFWPMTMIRLPPRQRAQDRRVAEVEVRADLLRTVLVVRAGSRRRTHRSDVTWFHQRIFPVLRSIAITESLVFTAGPVYELPVPM